MGRSGLIAMLAGTMLLCAGEIARAEEFTLVKDGKTDYVILLPAEPTTAESFAAEELAKYFKQMSGADFATQKSVELPPHAIVVAEKDSLTRDRKVGNKGGSGIEGEAYALVPNKQSIFLVGGTGRSTLYAVYQFLDRLGCRFLAPKLNHYEGSSEVIPKKPTLTISLDEPIVSKPMLAFRKLYVEEGHSHDAENLKQMAEWMPKVGYNALVVPTDYGGAGRVKWDTWRKMVTPELQKRDVQIEVGGHGYQNFLNAEMEGGKVFEKHPEWFGQDEKGNRHEEKGWVFCTSNEKARDYLIANFQQYVMDRREIQIFDFWPPDGAKWCECEECAKLGTPPDRQALLVNQVRESVRHVRPDLRIECLAYAKAIRPPEHERLHKDVLLDFCPIQQSFDHQINDPKAPKNAEYVDSLKAWREKFDGDISIYSYYRKYAWDSLPVIIPHYMQKDLQFYATIPVQGISTYAEPADWFTYELNHYVLAALAWDVNADVGKLVTKFCEARYGDQSGPAARALLTLQDVTRNTCSIPATSLKSADVIAADQEKIDRMLEAVNVAAKQARDPAISRNLSRLALMLEYAHRDLEIQKMRAANASKDEIRAKATAVHEFVNQHGDDGVFLVKDHRLSLPRMLSRYGVGDKEKPQPPARAGE